MSGKVRELTVVEADAPAEWRSRDEVDALAKRIQAMLPGDPTRDEALALAQYSAALDANPFRGEVYAYPDGRGGMVLTEGYKLLVRWARRQCQFYDSYKPLDPSELKEGDIGFRAFVLREDAKDMLQTLVDAGAKWDEAFEIAAQAAVGVVTKADRTSRKGQFINPPKGWTWEDVARKRALKNALNRAYGAPSPREIARESWRVDDVVTVPEDWPDDTNMLPVERELTAAANAVNRQRGASDVDAATAFNELFDKELPAQDGGNGGETVEGTEDPAEEEKVEGEKGGNNKPADPSTAFWTAVNQVGITRDDGLHLLAECKDDFAVALAKLQEEFPV